MSAASEVIDAWIAAELHRDPVLATSLGVPGHDDRLGDLSAPAMEARASDDRRWAARIDALVGSAEDPADRIDLTFLLAELAGRDVLDEWGGWRRDPAPYVDTCLHGVYLLFLEALRPEPELVAAAIARLAEVPAVAAAARGNLDPEVVPPLLARRGADAARAGATYFRDLLATSATDPGLQADLGAAGARAAEVMDDLAAHLDALAGRARGDWALGEGRYDALLRQRELLGVGAAELHARGLAAWGSLDAEMSDLARRIDPAAAGWHPVVAGLAAEHPATVEDMLRGYTEECDRARAFLAERGLVTLPDGEECLVVPSPVFQRPLLAVASYSPPPAFSTSRTGRFFVPYPPEGTTPEELEDRLADNGWHAIPTTTVHEAYPGHHWQMTHSAAGPRPLRKVLWSSYFVEGWALYAEGMMRREGYFTDPRAELAHLDARIFRAARVVVDTALHTGEMTPEEAVAYMGERASLTPAVARAEVDRYCAWPTQAPSYLTGALELERMWDRWAAEGRGGLRDFHDAVAADRGLPPALTELAVFGA